MGRTGSTSGLRVVIPSEVVFRELEGETVLVDLRSQEYFGLDRVGTRIWNLLSRNGSIELAIDTLVQEYDVEANVMKRDMEAFISRLEKAGLIGVAPAEDADG